MVTQTVIQGQQRLSPNGLSQSITARIQELAKATDAARMSAEMVRYLEACARFHQYSPFNIWLILMTCPHASHVAGYQTWRSLGRFVRKGERGIAILAPVFYREDSTDPDSRQVLTGFRSVYVFDVSQTEGKPLPEPPDWKSPEQNQLLFERLVEFARDKNIQVVIKKLPGSVQGVSMGGTIQLDPGAGTKTLIHELGHELLHSMEKIPSTHAERELEAEAVAFVVGKHFGLEGLRSPNYISLSGATSEMIMVHMERIRKVAEEIIVAIENAPEKVIADF